MLTRAIRYEEPLYPSTSRKLPRAEPIQAGGLHRALPPPPPPPPPPPLCGKFLFRSSLLGPWQSCPPRQATPQR